MEGDGADSLSGSVGHSHSPEGSDGGEDLEYGEGKPAKRGRRRLPEPDVDKSKDPELHRAVIRRQRNRANAAASRQRKAEQFTNLKHRVEELEALNLQLAYENITKQQEINSLSRELSITRSASLGSALPSDTSAAPGPLQPGPAGGAGWLDMRRAGSMPPEFTPTPTPAPTPAPSQFQPSMLKNSSVGSNGMLPDQPRISLVRSGSLSVSLAPPAPGGQQGEGTRERGDQGRQEAATQALLRASSLDMQFMPGAGPAPMQRAGSIGLTDLAANFGALNAFGGDDVGGGSMPPILEGLLTGNGGSSESSDAQLHMRRHSSLPVGGKRSRKPPAGRTPTAAPLQHAALVLSTDIPSTTAAASPSPLAFPLTFPGYFYPPIPEPFSHLAGPPHMAGPLQLAGQEAWLGQGAGSFSPFAAAHVQGDPAAVPPFDYSPGSQSHSPVTPNSGAPHAKHAQHAHHIQHGATSAGLFSPRRPPKPASAVPRAGFSALYRSGSWPGPAGGDLERGVQLGAPPGVGRAPQLPMLRPHVPWRELHFPVVSLQGQQASMAALAPAHQQGTQQVPCSGPAAAAGGAAQQGAPLPSPLPAPPGPSTRQPTLTQQQQGQPVGAVAVKQEGGSEVDLSPFACNNLQFGGMKWGGFPAPSAQPQQEAGQRPAQHALPIVADAGPAAASAAPSSPMKVIPAASQDTNTKAERIQAGVEYPFPKLTMEPFEGLGEGSGLEGGLVSDTFGGQEESMDFEEALSKLLNGPDALDNMDVAELAGL